MNIVYDNFDACLIDVEQTLKSLLYKRHPSIFDRIDFEDDSLFSEPLLYSYLTQNDNKWLDSIILGYEYDRVRSISIFTNAQGIAYLPQIGYFETPYLRTELVLNNDLLDYKVYKINGEIAEFSYYPLTFLSEGFELVTAQHPLWERLYIDAQDIQTDVNVMDRYAINQSSFFNSAIDIIKFYTPDYFKLIKSNVKKVLLFNGDANCFASMSAHNMIFLNIYKTNNPIFYLDHILHEGSHVVFNTLTFKTKQNLFTVKFNSNLSELTGNVHDSGELYGQFHGLFTQSHINYGLAKYYRAKIFNGEESHELLGRLASNLTRFRSGVDVFNQPSKYNSEGRKWYDFFCERFAQLYNENMNTISHFDLSNQPYVFNYEKFKQLNPA